VHTARRDPQSEPSPAAQRDAAPEGTRVVKTHFNTFMPAIIGLGMIALFAAWIVSRVRSERRFVFHAETPSTFASCCATAGRERARETWSTFASWRRCFGGMGWRCEKPRHLQLKRGSRQGRRAVGCVRVWEPWH